MPDVSFYEDGLAQILTVGRKVPSVRGRLSTASHFGVGDRPWREIIAHQFSFSNSHPFLFQSSDRPIHVPYCIGLLVWTLAGRNDVEAMAYYRPSAREYSDDGLTMCGAFGARLFGLQRSADQITSIITRLQEDPASRRTYAVICAPGDNLFETREYPCAAGIQLFLRNGELDMVTTMRAQQALTVLPYDVFLFSTLHHFIASDLGVATGRYHHNSGTFHIYEDEVAEAGQICATGVDTIELPVLESRAGNLIWRELAQVEQGLREAASDGDMERLMELSKLPLQFRFNQVARRYLVAFAHKLLAGSTAR